MVEDPHFRFEHELSGSETKQVFTQKYRSLADHVAPEAVAAYAQNVDRARAEVGYEYYYDADAGELAWPARINWMLVLLAAMMFAFFVWLARRVYRWDPAPHPVAARDRLEGIRGWLLLPALGVLVAPFIPLWELTQSAAAYMHPSWETLTHPGGDSYHAAWAPLLLYELAVLLGTSVLSLLVLVLFFRKRSSAPVVYVVSMAVMWVLFAADVAFIAALDLPGVENEPETIGQLRTQLLSALLWSAYMLQSRRVHSTFVRRLVPVAADATVASTDDATAAPDAPATQGWGQYGIPEARGEPAPAIRG